MRSLLSDEQANVGLKVNFGLKVNVGLCIIESSFLLLVSPKVPTPSLNIQTVGVSSACSQIR